MDHQMDFDDRDPQSDCNRFSPAGWISGKLPDRRNPIAHGRQATAQLIHMRSKCCIALQKCIAKPLVQIGWLPD